MVSEQELMMKFSVFEKQINQLQEQIQAVEQGIVELNELYLGLNEINSGKDKEILATIGRGIFVEAKLISDDLTVDIGNNNFVTKSVDETKEMISKQIEKLGNIKDELNNNMEELGKEIESAMREHKESLDSEEKPKHKCKSGNCKNPNCKCED